MPPSVLPARSDSDRANRLTEIGIGVLIALGLLRAAFTLVYAMLELPASDQPFTLEGASVYFAWCVQHGLPLYPEGNGPSYTVNYMGPCYFWLVGFIGRLLDADIGELYVIGRAVTLFFAICPAVVAALYLQRRYGRWAGLAGLIFGLGSVPMLWYGIRTRPDVMADALGVGGFFVACSLGRRWLPAAAVLLAVSCLTKQTFGILWLLATMSALMFRPCRRRRAFVLVGICAAFVTAAVALLEAAAEPHIASNLLAQGAMSFSPLQSLYVAMQLMDHSPEMVFFVLIGFVLWSSRRWRDQSLLILAAVLLVGTVLSCAKIGSNLNYFIPLGVVEALAAGTLCVAAVRSEQHHRLAWTMASWAAAAAVAVSTYYAGDMTALAIERRLSEIGQARRLRLEHFQQLAGDPNVRLLTDSDRLAVYQGQRAAFVDVFLFRLEVNAGRRDPRYVVERLKSRWYQYVILSADVVGAYDERFFYALPAEVAKAIESNYRLKTRDGEFFVYVPRAASDRTLAAAARRPPPLATGAESHYGHASEQR